MDKSDKKDMPSADSSSQLESSKDEPTPTPRIGFKEFSLGIGIIVVSIIPALFLMNLLTDLTSPENPSSSTSSSSYFPSE